jgi:hypothetical protein
MSRYASPDQTPKVVESMNEDFLSSLLVTESEPQKTKKNSSKKKSKKA